MVRFLLLTALVLLAPGLQAAEPLTLKGHTGWVGGVAFSPDGKTLATASADKSVKLWTVETGKELTTLKGHEDYVTCVAFHPDGKHLATGSFDHTAKYWDLEKQTEMLTLKGHKGAVLTVCLRPVRPSEEAVLLTGSIDGKKLLWSGSEPDAEVLPRHNSWVNAIVSGQNALASASSDGTIHLMGNDGRNRVLNPKAAELRSLSFTHDGKFLAVGARYGLVKVYDTEKAQEVATLKGHAGDVWAVAFSHDGKILASGDGDWNRPGDIRLWDTTTWKEKALLQHTGEVLCLAFSPKKNLLAAGSWDKTVKIWDLGSK